MYDTKLDFFKKTQTKTKTTWTSAREYIFAAWFKYLVNCVGIRVNWHFIGSFKIAAIDRQDFDPHEREAKNKIEKRIKK